MTLCVFALIASEFLPVSLLTPLAGSLQISEGLAGYGLAISGAFAVVTSLLVPALAGTIDRKHLLLGLTAVMGISGLIVGMASSYGLYLFGRALIGVVVGGFWSMSAAVAMRLVPAESVPKALAIFNSGNALATVVAAPLGSYLGSVIGWRGAFFCLVPVVMLALIWQWMSLPSLPALPRRKPASSALRLLRNPFIALGMFGVGLFFVGQFMLFTYVRPFLEQVTRVPVSTLSLILLGIGIAGLIGTTLIGRIIRRGLYRALILIPLGMAVIGLCLTLFGHTVAVVTVLLGAWGLLATAAPVGWWAWIARTLPADAESGGGLMVAVIQLCIAFGSTLGGALFDGPGYQATFITSAGILLAAAILAILVRRLANQVTG